MSKNSTEFEIWRRNWLCISGEEGMYNNKLVYNNQVLEPDICNGFVVVNFIAPPVNMKAIKKQTDIYYALGYEVFWIINLIPEFKQNKLMIVRVDKEAISFKYACIYNNILKNMVSVANKSNVYFEIGEELPLYKLKNNTDECYFCVEMRDNMSRLDFISENIFGYRTIYKEM